MIDKPINLKIKMNGSIKCWIGVYKYTKYHCYNYPYFSSKKITYCTKLCIYIDCNYSLKKVQSMELTYYISKRIFLKNITCFGI